MISDREWDEMRVAKQLRLKLLREEIRRTRQGNRQDAIEGVANAATEQARGAAAQSGSEEERRERDIAISEILEQNPGQ